MKMLLSLKFIFCSFSAKASMVCSYTALGPSAMEYQAVLDSFSTTNTDWLETLWEQPESGPVLSSYITSISIDKNKIATVTYYSDVKRSTLSAKYKVSWSKDVCPFPTASLL